MTNPVYRTAAWRQASARTLARDGYACMIGLPKCKGRATTADHIVELEDGGDPFALENLQAACRSCNTSKHLRKVHARNRRVTNGLQRW